VFEDNTKVIVLTTDVLQVALLLRNSVVKYIFVRPELQDYPFANEVVASSDLLSIPAVIEIRHKLSGE
jgi:hypothetical protein